MNSAFLALDVRVGQHGGGIDIRGAYPTGVPADELPAATSFVAVGDYEFELDEVAAAHSFDAEVFAPEGAPPARFATEPSPFAPFGVSPDDARLHKGFVFVVKVDLGALVYGTHVVALTLDGQTITTFFYEVLKPLGGAAPDDLSGLTDE
uniref:hypothetical protein n=1 Tax=Sphingomonas bacterium TaxID=1895847 RepID=UPI002622EFC3|nr:hypothetical protein [Sphingomonas bacterium]